MSNRKQRIKSASKTAFTTLGMALVAGAAAAAERADTRYMTKAQIDETYPTGVLHALLGTPLPPFDIYDGEPKWHVETVHTWAAENTSYVRLGGAF